MATRRDAALRKRQQIAKASQLMFLWVAGASIVVGASTVGIYSLGSKLLFNEKVLSEKSKTVDVLKHNNSIVQQLKDNVRVLNTNQSLIDLRTPADNEPVQVILDSMPSSANSAALGASLQSDKLLGQSGVKIESLDVSSVPGVESTSASSGSGTGDNTIQFQFSVSVALPDANKLKEVTQSLEKSIRAFKISTLRVEQQGNRLLMSVSGSAFYQPSVEVQLKDKVVKP